MKSPRIYLAGPTCFELNAQERYDTLKAICAKYGMVGVSPMDNEIENPDGALPPHAIATQIQVANAELISTCDAIIADVTPFRGIEPDSGTCVEIGMGLALGKMVATYSAQNAFTYAQRVQADREVETVDGEIIDKVSNTKVEDFGLCQNLMIAIPCSCFATPEHAIGHLATRFKAKDAPTTLWLPV